MEIYLKGTPNEINDFLYCDCDEHDDDEEVEVSPDVVKARMALINFILDKRKELSCSKSAVDYVDLVYEVMKRVRAYAKAADNYIKP